MTRLNRCVIRRAYATAKSELPAAKGSRFQQPSPLPPKSVGIWLMASSTLVFSIIVVGGVTRLTESGLSITEWRPITGILPPLSQTEWEDEFTKYKATPEFKLCVKSTPNFLSEPAT